MTKRWLYMMVLAVALAGSMTACTFENTATANAPPTSPTAPTEEPEPEPAVLPAVQ